MFKKLRAGSTALLASCAFLLVAAVSGGNLHVTALPPAQQNQPYCASISVYEGTAPYQFKISSGSLPDGITLNPNTGDVCGTPTSQAGANFSVRVTDLPHSESGTASFYLKVFPAPVTIPVTISLSPLSATLPSGSTQQFTASVSGTTNTAIAWTASSGTISSSGLFTAPAVSSSTTVTVTAMSVADATKSASASVTVNPLPTVGIAISPTSASIKSGGTQQFSASVSSTSNTSVTWSSNGGSISATGLFTAPSVNTDTAFVVTVTSVADPSKAASASVDVTASATPPPPPPPSTGFDGPAELPRVYLQTAMSDTPAPGTTIQVAAGGSLQTALNNAKCGDTVSLAAGATFSGIFNFPAKACDDQNWIIVRTSAPDSSLPLEGSRLNPCYAGVASLPGRPPFNCPSGQNVLAKIIDPQGNSSGPIVLASGSNHYRLVGLEITRAVAVAINFQLVSVPTGQADHIYLDRVWLHGTPQDETKNGINLAGITYGALIDSYNTDFHCTAVVGSCTDAKVVGGGNSTFVGGPYKITNNFLEASGENILFGGGSATTTPTDIEIRNNHFYKPLTWLTGQPNFVAGASGHPFMVKNLLELKNAQRVLVEGNIFEYSWGGFSQNGFALLLTPKNQASGCPGCEVTDVTIRYNTFSHSGAGISIANVPDDNGAIATAGERYSIHDITLDDISGSKYNGNGVLFQVLSGWPTSALNNISVDHVTGFPDAGGTGKLISLGNQTTYPTMFGFSFTNSIIGQDPYPVWSAGGSSSCAISNVPLTALNTCFPQGYTFSHNAMIAVSQQNYPPSKWPTNNFFPPSTSAVQFAGASDYHLQPSSPYAKAGTDGKDLGADIDAIQTAIAGVY